MGGGKGGGGTSTQYSGVQIPQEVLQRYNKATDRAENVSQTPWSNYGGEFVAPVNDTQQAGYGTMMAGQNYTNAGWQMPNQSLAQGVNAAAPLLDQAGGSINTGQIQGQALGAAGLGQAAQAYNQAQPYNQQAGQAFNQAIGQYGGAYAGAQPYQGAATGAAVAGMGAVDPSQLNLNQFYNPYQQQVTEATMAQLGQQQAQQRNDQRGQMIKEGSFGGDRSGVANANMVNQQNLASAQVLGQLNTANYGQALSAAQQQQGVGLGAAQANRQAIQQGAGQLLGIGQQGYQQGLGYGQALQGAGTAQQGLGAQQYTQGMGQAQYTGQMGQQMYGQGVGAGQAQQGLGAANYGMYGDVAAKQAALAGQAFGQNLQTAQGQMGFGTMQQQTQQAQDSAMYNQWLQEQGYPYQASQFYTNAVMGTGPLSGSSSYSGAFTPQPFFSDDRVKENMEQIGRTHDGQAIYRFNYRGQPGTQIGLSAQEVEKRHPEAVSEHGGVKAVDYAAATADAADRPGKAGGGALGGDPFGYIPPNTLAPGVGVLGIAPTLPGGAPTGGLGDIVARQKAMFGANAPGSGPGAPLGLPSQAGISAPTAPPAGAGAPPRPADPTAPVAAAAAAEAGPRAVPSFIEAGGSTGGTEGTGGVGGSATDGSGGSAAAGVGGDDGGTYASGGRTGYAKGGSKADGYAGGFGDLDNIMAAQASMYGNAPWAQKAAAGTGSIIPQLQAAKASQLIKPDLPKAPAAPAKTGAQEGLGAANDAVKTAESFEKAYGMGKDVLVGEPQKGTAAIPGVGKPSDSNYVKAVPASDNYKPATGGWFGHHGKWGAEAPPKTDPATAPATAPATVPATAPATAPAPSPAATAPPTSVSSNPAANTLPAAPVAHAAPDQVSDATSATKDLGDLSTDTNVADLSGLADTSNLLADAGNLGDAANLAESGTAVADAAPLLEDAAMFAKKGGRVGYSGLDKDSSAVPFSGTSILPEGVYDVEDPSKLAEAPKPDEKGGSGSGKKDNSAAKAGGTLAGMGAGAAIGSIVPGIGTLVGAGLGATIGGAGASMLAARGGRTYAEGGEVNDNEPPEPGLGSASSAMEDADNVHWGVFSRSQGHKMVARAASKKRARNMVDKHDNAYGAYDHFLKPIPPTRKRAYGGRLAYADAGEVTAEDEAAERELVAEKLRQRDAEALGAAKTDPTEALNPNAQAIEEGRQREEEANKQRQALGAVTPGVKVAGPSMPVPSTAESGVGAANPNPNVVPVAAPPPPPTPPPSSDDDPLGTKAATVAPTVPKPAVEPPKPAVVPPPATTPAVPPSQNNPGNVMGPDGKPWVVPTFNQGVGLLVNTATSYPARFNKDSQGNPVPMTIAQIGQHWAPVGASNDPNNLNKNWIPNVTREYTALGGDPNKPVDFSDPKQAALFAAAVHRAEHPNVTLPLSAYDAGVAMANDPDLKKGFSSGGVGNASTKAPGATDTAADVQPSAGGLGGASPESKSLWGQSKDWFDRNESWGVPLLTGLGAMFSSPSRTFLGSLGTGMVAGGTQYGTLGQRQQGIDIQKQTQNIAQAGKISEAMTNIARERSGVLAANPHADVSAYDKIYNQLRNKHLQLVGAGGISINTTPGSYSDYIKTQAPAIQTFSSQVAPRDNFVALYQNAMTTQDPTERAARLREADAALERARAGQAVGLDGKALGLTPELTEALLRFKTQSASAETTGTQQTPQAAVGRIMDEQKSILQRYNVPDSNGLPPDARKQYDDLQARLEAQRRAAGMRAGGRVGRRFGGLSPDLSATDDPDAVTTPAVATDADVNDDNIQQAQMAPLPPPSSKLPGPTAKPAPPPPAAGATPQPTGEQFDRNNPEHWDRRSTALGGLGDAPGAAAAAAEAQRLREAARGGTKMVTEDGKEVVKPTPGAFDLDQKKWQHQQNQKTLEWAQGQSLAAEIQKQELAKYKSTLFDENGNPKTTMGPFSELLGPLAQMSQQLLGNGDVARYITGISSSDREVAEKSKIALAQAIAASGFGSKETQGIFDQVLKNTPGTQLSAAAAAFMIDHVLLPKANFDAGIYDHLHKGDIFNEDYWARRNQYYRDNKMYPPTYGRVGDQGKTEQTETGSDTIPDALTGIKNLEKNKKTGEFRDADTGKVYDKKGNLKGAP